jgi:hypothetical protein
LFNGNARFTRLGDDAMFRRHPAAAMFGPIRRSALMTTMIVRPFMIRLAGQA